MRDTAARLAHRVKNPTRTGQLPVVPIVQLAPSRQNAIELSLDQATQALSKTAPIHAGCAGHAGAVTRLPSVCASSIASSTYVPPALVTSGATAG